MYVATEDKNILDDVNLNGGKAILTSNKHKTGSDRIFECFEIFWNIWNIWKYPREQKGTEYDRWG